jgi:hypothetical protein
LLAACETVKHDVTVKAQLAPSQCAPRPGPKAKAQILTLDERKYDWFFGWLEAMGDYYKRTGC